MEHRLAMVEVRVVRRRGTTAVQQVEPRRAMAEDGVVHQQVTRVEEEGAVHLRDMGEARVARLLVIAGVVAVELLLATAVEVLVVPVPVLVVLVVVQARED